MKNLINDQLGNFFAVVESAGVPALRFASTAGIGVFAAAGVFIWRSRHQFFDRDPEVEEDGPVARRHREEEILLVWSGLTLVLLVICYQVWNA
jgi:hypothetical protein